MEIHLDKIERFIYYACNTRKKTFLTAKVCTGVCLQLPFVPLQLTKTFQYQIALSNFKAEVRVLRLLWFKCKSNTGTLRGRYLISTTRFFIVSSIAWSDIADGHQIVVKRSRDADKLTFMFS